MPNNPYTLVIIDMQYDFDVHHERRTIANVKKEIVAAKKKKANILFVEYLGFGSTYDPLVKLAPTAKLIRKLDMDGSSEIVEAIQKHNFNWQRLRICGLFAECCVRFTTLGLLSHCQLKDSKIQVVKKATDQFTRTRHWWKKMYGKHKNLRLINELNY